MGMYHVFVEYSLLLECFSEVALQLLVVWHAAGCVCDGSGGRGDVFGHVGRDQFEDGVRLIYLATVG